MCSEKVDIEISRILEISMSFSKMWFKLCQLQCLPATWWGWELSKNVKMMDFSKLSGADLEFKEFVRVGGIYL